MSSQQLPATRVPAFDLPASAFLREESLRAIALYQTEMSAYGKVVQDIMSSADAAAMPRIRTQLAEAFYQTPLYLNLLERYPVEIELESIGGVPCEIVTPLAGIAAGNAARVLINFHGGGFQGGSQTNSRLESVPIAALGGIRAISVDYRMAPEYQHPAYDLIVEFFERHLERSSKVE